MSTPTPTTGDGKAAGRGARSGQRPSQRQNQTGRSRRSRRARFADRTAQIWRRLLETPAVWLVLLLTVGTWALTPRGFFPAPEVVEGGVAARDYVASEDLLIPDEETTREKQARAREDVPPVYDFDPGAADELQERLAALFAAGRQVLSPPQEGAGRPAGASESSGRREPAVAEETQLAPSEMASVLTEASGLRIAPDEAAALRSAGFADDLEDRTRSLTVHSLRRGIVEGKSRLLENRVRGVTLRNLSTGTEQRHYDLYDHLEYPGEVREFLETEVSDWRDLTAAQRRAVVGVLMANLPANLSPNRKETLERQDAAEAATAPVFKQIRKGQVIVRKGDQIDPAAARVISALTGERRRAARLLPILGTFALVALAALALWLGLEREQVADHGRKRLYSEALVILLVSLLGTKFCYAIATALADSFDAAPFDAVRSYVYGVPFAGLALVTALLLGRTAATLISFVFAVLVTRLAGPDALWVAVYAAVGSLGAVYAVDAYQIKQRLTLTRVGLLVGGLNVVAVLLLTATAAGGGLIDPLQLGFDLICALGGGLLVAAVGSFSVPILESTLGITTDIKLVELANANLPLLRRLAFEAPGTFQHSLMVANLAKEGCEAIDADPVLGYTGGLYHDVGKMVRPDYFVENQRPGHNPHDKLVPSMSVLIIVSHVKDGLVLADEHRLPPPIRDAIAQHHGTRRLNYFYERAKERAERGEEVTEEKYRYPGPKPQNKVMGVLMLADGVEAASRTLTEPSPLRLRTVVQKIVDDCMADGQLDESDLTLSDVKRVRNAFIRVLTTIFHQRIDYPGFDFKGETRSERRSERDVEAARAS
ncbi:MAG: HDIG domain-containing protein [Acidobacteriota bacterium]|jgi:putative nucleotidyltransferase with HDIG domain